MEINLKIIDETKANIILSLLKDLPYVEILSPHSVEKAALSAGETFETAKKKNLSTADIRKEAWKR